MSRLPQGGDYDRRLQTLPRGVIKFNGVRDDQELLLNARRITNRGNVLFNGSSLRGEYANEASKIYEFEPVFIVKPNAWNASSRNFDQSAMRTLQTQEYRTPVVSVVNGAPGLTAADIQSRYTYMGVAEQTGRASGSDGLNIIPSGLVTLTNQGPRTIYAGQYWRCKVPDVNVPDELQLHPPSGDIANALGQNGRMPWITTVYDPNDTDFYNIHTVRLSMEGMFDCDLTDGTFSLKNPMPAESSDHYKRCYDRTILRLHQTLADLLNTVSGVGKADAVSSAARMLYLSGETGVSLPTFAGNKVDWKLTANEISIFKNNPMQKLLQSLGAFRLEIQDTVMGRSVHTVPPGKDGDVLLGHLSN